MTEEEVEGLINYLESFIDAKIAEKSDNEPDSMGSYYERKHLKEFILLVTNKSNE